MSCVAAPLSMYPKRHGAICSVTAGPEEGGGAVAADETTTVSIAVSSPLPRSRSSAANSGSESAGLLLRSILSRCRCVCWFVMWRVRKSSDRAIGGCCDTVINIHWLDPHKTPPPRRKVARKEGQRRRPSSSQAGPDVRRARAETERQDTERPARPRKHPQALDIDVWRSEGSNNLKARWSVMRPVWPGPRHQAVSGLVSSARALFW
jgi:hypothetical protein